MSVYNGFLNHDQQVKYYTMIQYLIHALEKRLVKFYQNQGCNEAKFVQILVKINKKINKMEQGKYNQPKFSNIISHLLDIVYPQHMKEYNRKSNMSSISSSLNFLQKSNSQFSFDFNLDPIDKTSRINSIKKHNEDNQFHSSQKMKHRSLDTLKQNVVIDQIQGECYNQSQKSLKNKIHEFKSMRMKLNPPKLGEYIQKIKRQSKFALKYSKSPDKLKTVDEFEQPYIGQRRKKTKKFIRI